MKLQGTFYSNLQLQLIISPNKLAAWCLQLFNGALIATIFPEKDTQLYHCYDKKVNMNTAAVITAYHPDANRIKENLEAIASQVNLVIVYNNGALPNLEALISKKSYEKVVVLGSGTNVGLPVAFNTSFRKALDLGYDSVLLLDQDSVAPDSLVSVLANYLTKPEIAIVGPSITDRAIPSNSKVSSRLPDAPLPVERVISSGSLINLNAWKLVGGYNERLKIDWVDFEFCANLRLHGFKILKTSQIALLHELGHRTPSIVVPQFSGSSFQLKQFYSTNHSTERRVDKARSWAISLSRFHGTAIYNQELSYIIRTFIRDLLVEPSKIKLLQSYKRGFSLGQKEN